MTVNHVSRSVFVVLLLAVYVLVLCGAHDSAQTFQINLLKSAELRSERLVPLGQQPLLIVSDGENQKKEIPVLMVEMEYLCELVSVGKDGRRKERSIPLRCYEIRSKGDVPYMWAMWPGMPAGHLRLFVKRNGKNILTWVETSNVFFAEVSEPKDRLVELTEFLSRQGPAGFERIPVGTLVPEARTWGVNALFFDILVRSMEVDAAGRMTVKLSGPDSGKVYTLVGDGEKWQRK